jgi:hypothetical protein
MCKSLIGIDLFFWAACFAALRKNRFPVRVGWKGRSPQSYAQAVWKAGKSAYATATYAIC